jgi:chromatin assembly factor 1 subunit B
MILVIIGDTESSEPLAVIGNIHPTRLSDITWSNDGKLLLASSTDGYCSIITFEENELGRPYPMDKLPELVPNCFPIEPKPAPVKQTPKKKASKEDHPKSSVDETPKKGKKAKDKQEPVKKSRAKPANLQIDDKGREATPPPKPNQGELLTLHH